MTDRLGKAITVAGRIADGVFRFGVVVVACLFAVILVLVVTLVWVVST